MNDLLKCPFCGGTPTLEDHRLIFSVDCECDACVIGDRLPEPVNKFDITEADVERAKQSAINKWNRRC